MNFPNVFICGQMGSGKTTAAKHLCATYGYELISMNRPILNIDRLLREDGVDAAIKCTRGLCDSVRYASKEFFGVAPVSVYGLPEDMKSRAARLIRHVDTMPIEESSKQRARMQAIGHGMREQVTDNFWLFLLLLVCHNNPTRHYVCDSVRYVNEATLLRHRGWKGIVLNVSSDVQKKRLISLYGSVGNIDDDSEQDITKVRSLGLGTNVDGDVPADEMSQKIDAILGFE
jgi:hypothetical protein